MKLQSIRTSIEAAKRIGFLLLLAFLSLSWTGCVFFQTAEVYDPTIELSLDSGITNQDTISIHVDAVGTYQAEDTNPQGRITYNIQKIEYYVDGEKQGELTENLSSSYRGEISGIALTGNKPQYTIRVTVFSKSRTASDEKTVVVDKTRPAVNILDPVNNMAIEADSVTLRVRADDDNGISTVGFSTDSGSSGSLADNEDDIYTCNVSLAGGRNIITVTAADIAGNRASADVEVNYNIPAVVEEVAIEDTEQIIAADTTLPHVRITSPSHNSETMQRIITVTGTAADDVGIRSLYYSLNHGDSVYIIRSGSSWNIQVGMLNPGENRITVTAYDASGNGNSDTITVIYRDSPPEIIMESSCTTSADEILITGQAKDNSEVAGITYSLNGAPGQDITLGDSSTTDGEVYIPFTIRCRPLLLGQNALLVTAVDEEGNETSASAVISFIDDQSPEVVIISPADNVRTLTGTINVQGYVADNSEIESMSYSLNNGADVPIDLSSGIVGISFDSDGRKIYRQPWAIDSLQLRSGSNSLTVTAVDISGNESSSDIAIIRTVITEARPVTDSESPTVTITVPVPNYEPGDDEACYATGTERIDIAGTAHDNNGVTGISYTLNSGYSVTIIGYETEQDVEWHIDSLRMDPGLNTLTVTANDASGRTGSGIVDIYYDNAAPDIEVTNPAAPLVYINGNIRLNRSQDGSVTMGGTAADTAGFGVVMAYRINGGEEQALELDNGLWSLNLEDIGDGDVITVEATDFVGNSSSVSFVVTSLPIIEITEPDEIKYDSFNNIIVYIDVTGSAVMSGTAYNYDTLEYSINGGDGQPLAVEDGAWSIVLNGAATGCTVTVTASNSTGSTRKNFIIQHRVIEIPSICITYPEEIEYDDESQIIVYIEDGFITIAGTAEHCGYLKYRAGAEGSLVDLPVDDDGAWVINLEAEAGTVITIYYGLDEDDISNMSFIALNPE